MALKPRFFVRSPDGRMMFGLETAEAAETAAKAYGEGALVVDTYAQTYMPMLSEVIDGELVYAGYGGWTTGRFGLEYDLIEAVKKGHPALVQAFLEKGADAKARDKNGGSALHWAVGGGKIQIVELLLKRGADPSVVDRHDQTPLQLAEKRGRTEIAAILGKLAS